MNDLNAAPSSWLATATGCAGSLYDKPVVNCWPFHSCGATPFRGWKAKRVAVLPGRSKGGRAGDEATAAQTKGTSFTLPWVTGWPVLSQSVIEPLARLSAYGTDPSALAAYVDPVRAATTKTAATKFLDIFLTILSRSLPGLTGDSVTPV